MNFFCEIIPQNFKFIYWKPPREEWIKLNTDGAAKLETCEAAAGGILRDSTGKWRGGFKCNVGPGTAFTAELWGVLYGLELAWELGFRKIELEVDNNTVARIINNQRCNGKNFYFKDELLIKRIKGLLAKDWEVKTSFIYREANFCADKLAKLGYNIRLGFVKLTDLPRELSNLIVEDGMGVARLRFGRS